MRTRTCGESRGLLLKNYELLPGGFPLATGRLGKDLALVDTVERRAQLDARSSANHIAADVLQKRELFRAGIEGDEVGLHAAFALPPDVARDVIWAASVRVLAVGDDEQVLTEHARAIQVGTRL